MSLTNSVAKAIATAAENVELRTGFTNGSLERPFMPGPVLRSQPRLTKTLFPPQEMMPRNPIQRSAGRILDTSDIDESDQDAEA